jgi:hypothetical protein
MEYEKKYNDKVGILIQRFFYYKLNLNVPSYSQWEGTRICRLKYLKSFSWLRDKVKIKNLKYGFWRFDKEKSIQIINDGGWHFNYLLKPEDIARKFKSLAQTSWDKEEYFNEENIKKNFPLATILRPSIVYSVDDNFTTNFMTLLNRLPAFPLYYNGNTKFVPIHCSDLTDIIYHLMVKFIIIRNLEKNFKKKVFCLKLTLIQKFYLNY